MSLGLYEYDSNPQLTKPLLDQRSRQAKTHAAHHMHKYKKNSQFINNVSPTTNCSLPWGLSSVVFIRTPVYNEKLRV
eukprot:5335566-Amphidinium_carterae.1